jgi:hypothetical protein
LWAITRATDRYKWSRVVAHPIEDCQRLGQFSCTTSDRRSVGSYLDRSCHGLAAAARGTVANINTLTDTLAPRLAPPPIR